MADAIESSLAISIVYNGVTHSISLPSVSATLALLESSILCLLSLSNPKLIHKGRVLNPISTPRSTLLSALLPSAQIKLFAVGTTVDNLAAARAVLDQREAKSLAFQYHKLHLAPKLRNTTDSAAKAKAESYRFLRVVPFPESVPFYRERVAMLDRLAKDEAIRSIMLSHEFAVGVLTELHPIKDPTILGLNVGAGMEVKLRLLTDAVDGLRSYAVVRMVLIHELAHNTFGPHDGKFHRLNSELTKLVKAYEASHGISVGPDTSVWTPSSDPLSEEDRSKRFERRLDEVVVASTSSRMSDLMLSEEDEVEERRERARLAAERRLL